MATVRDTLPPVNNTPALRRIVKVSVKDAYIYNLPLGPEILEDVTNRRHRTSGWQVKRQIDSFIGG